MGVIKKISVIFFVIFIDQISKYIIRSTGGFYICNKGIAFGIEFPQMILVALWALFFVFAAQCLFGSSKNKTKETDQGRIEENKGKDKKLFDFLDVDWCDNLYFFLLLGGGISNLIDRVLLGCVTDFIDLGAFPVFNVADAFISLGAIMMISKVSRLKK